jgi:predicted PurR-regulated permease PerM
MKSLSSIPLLAPLVIAIWIAVIIFVLITQKMLLVPLVLGLLFAFFLLPMVRKMEKRRVPRIASILIMIIVSIAVVIGLGTLLSFAISQFVGDIPQYKEVLVQNTLTAQQFIERVADVPIATQQAWLADNVNLLELGTQNIGSIATGVGSIIATLGLTFIYTFFILYYRNKALVFFRKLLGQADEIAIFETFKKLIHIVPRYLSGVFWVMLILAVVNSLGFWILGVPNPIFFGVFAAILNIIPYAGPIIGFAVVVAFSFATVGPAIALGVVILSLVVQFIDNNLLTPNISGGTININPFTAIVGIIIGGSMWGIIGMIIALPILGMVKVIADSIPKLEPFGYLIGDEGTEEHALSWANLKKIFKKKPKLL